MTLRQDEAFCRWTGQEGKGSESCWGTAPTKAFTPSWDSPETLGSSLGWLAPSRTRHQTDAEVRGPPRQSLPELGWKLHPLNEMLIITALRGVCHPLKIGRVVLSAPQVRLSLGKQGRF